MGWGGGIPSQERADGKIIENMYLCFQLLKTINLNCSEEDLADKVQVRS